MIHHFFAYIARLRYIRRWGLMRSSMSENDAEHSLQVAMLAHGMALIGKNRYGRDCNPEHIVTLAVYHDASEVITGDMPTPVKYQSLELRGAYKDVEKMANDRLLAMLPEDLRGCFAPYLCEGHDYDHQIVKAADSLSAYLKCVEERRAGNHEFDAAGEGSTDGADALESAGGAGHSVAFLPPGHRPPDAPDRVGLVGYVDLPFAQGAERFGLPEEDLPIGSRLVEGEFAAPIQREGVGARRESGRKRKAGGNDGGARQHNTTFRGNTQGLLVYPIRSPLSTPDGERCQPEPPIRGNLPPPQAGTICPPRCPPSQPKGGHQFRRRAR